MRDSEVVEISADQLWLRTRHSPERWAIEGTAPNTFSSLKVDVPEFVPGKIYVNVQETGQLWWTLHFTETKLSEILLSLFHYLVFQEKSLTTVTIQIMNKSLYPVSKIFWESFECDWSPDCFTFMQQLL